MPAQRNSRLKVIGTMDLLRGKNFRVATAESVSLTSSSDEDEDPRTYFPETEVERKAYQTKGGKAVPPHHWDVYDFTRTIPRGKVTTYKEVCRAVGGSPRSVGNALRNNPFAPYIPCHRVIASTLFAGGYCGEWGAKSKTGTQYFRKLDFLEKEGLSFNQKGVLEDPDTALWVP
ncbi:hypothetical protein V5O48_001805 [Marasmius crinis-equi]|uniref:Methylated-DNA--protein-cysteine methyltransferase n=1 Tax=Marasmius crinis-equi TaxID=585013 RepID=A0ABR3FXH8_9AGAR